MAEKTPWVAPPPPAKPKAASNDPADRPIGVGDVVALKSGGHAMTVEKFSTITQDNDVSQDELGLVEKPKALVHCIWHSADGHFLDRVFWPHTLSRIIDPPQAEDKDPQPRDAGTGVKK